MADAALSRRVELPLVTQAAVAQRRERVGAVRRPDDDADGSGAESSAELVMVRAPMTPVAEALRNLRAQLGLHWKNAAQAQVLSVVSVERGEGRSFIAANLALAFAQLNERTLLVDTDLRYPRQHAIFGIGNGQGLSSLLGGRASAQDIQPVDCHPNLSVLPAGPPSAHPQELLASRSLRQVLEQCRAEFDVVILDTPAWRCGADAMLVCAQAGQALLVSAPGRATRDATERVVAALRQVDVAIAGAVVNRR